MENFITTFEEHILEKSLLNEGLHSFVTGTFNKKEAVKWLLKDGLKYITSYLLSHPNNKMTEPFKQLYLQNKKATNGWENPDAIDDKFLQVLDHFKNTFATRIKGGQPEGNVEAGDIGEFSSWLSAEESLLGKIL